MRGATIRDVAGDCGVSVSTVSRVLNDRPDVNRETRMRVRASMRELGYVPNNSARNLARNESATVAAIVRGGGNPFLARLLKAAETQMRRYGYALMAYYIDANADEMMTAAMLAAEKRLCGVLFLGGRMDYTPADVRLLNVPYVCLTYANTFGSLSKDGYSSAALDERQAARQVMEYLFQNGHRRIAVLLSEENDRSISELRFRGYREGLSALGLAYEPELVARSGGYALRDAYEATRALLSRRRDFTAVFAISDMMALACMKALYDEGLRVPEDCSVMGIDGLEATRYTIPELTTIVQPVEAIAEAGAARLAGLIRDTGGHGHDRFAPVLREGGTVEPPRQ